MGWSPEQIAGGWSSTERSTGISAESIYRHAYSPAGRRAGLPRLLAQRKPKRGRRRRNGRREPAIPNRTPIHQRPTKAHLRSQFGHWEGDLMHFRRQRDILLTLQERRSRLTLARRLLSKDADRRRSHRRGAGRAAGQGAPHHHPRQRRRVRAARGRHRRHRPRSLLLRPAQPVAARLDRERQRPAPPRPPRKTSLGDYTDADIDDVIWNLNTTPRESASATARPSRHSPPTSVSHLKCESSTCREGAQENAQRQRCSRGSQPAQIRHHKGLIDCPDGDANGGCDGSASASEPERSKVRLPPSVHRTTPAQQPSCARRSRHSRHPK
jgi:transposase, IS30 family